MAVLAFAGAETGNTSELSSPSGVTADTAPRSGKYSWRFSASGVGTFLFAAQSGPVYFRGYFLFTNTPSGNAVLMAFRNGAGTNQVDITMPAGANTLRVAGVTTTTLLSPNIWHRIELLADISSALVELKVNGKTELQLSSGVGSNIAQVALSGGTGPGFFYWDDVHVSTDGWAGPGYVIARQGRPGQATPSYTAFTKTGAALIEDVWSDAPFSAATFAASTAISQTQTMRVETPSTLGRGFKSGYPYIRDRDQILGAKVLIVAKRDASTPVDHYIARVVNGSLTLESIATATTDALFQSSIFTVPSYRHLDDCEIGAARGAGNANITVEDALLMVSCADGKIGVRHFIGFEIGNIDEGNALATTGTIATVSNIVHTGNYALQMIGPGAFFPFEHPMYPFTVARWDFPALFQSCYVYFHALDNSVFLRMLSSGRVAISFNVTATGNVIIRNDAGALLATIVGVVSTGRWIHIEIYYRGAINGSDGRAIVRIDGVEVFTSETMDAGAITSSFANAGATLNFSIDDIVLSDSSWPGAARVIARQGRAGAPNDDTWIKSGGTTIAEVWSNTPVGGGFARVSGATQTMLVASISGTHTGAQAAAAAGVADSSVGEDDIIIGVRIAAYANIFAASGTGGPHNLRRRLPASAPAPRNRDFPISIGDTGGALHYSDIFLATRDTLEQIEIGGNQTLGLSLPMVISDIWLMVVFAELEHDALALPTTQPIVSMARITAQLSPRSPTEELILSHNPAVYFRLDDDFLSEVIRDSSGHSRHGVRRGGGSIFIGGPYLGALANDPSTALHMDPTQPIYFEVPHADDFSLDQFTVIGWYMMLDGSNTQRGIWEKTTAGAYASSWIVDQITGNIRLWMSTSGGAKSVEASLGGAPKLSVWQPFAFTFINGIEMKAYLNGDLIATTSMIGTTLNRGIGIGLLGALVLAPGSGRLDEFAIIPKVLTQSEIRAIIGSQYRDVAGSYYRSVMMKRPSQWLRFNEPQGSTRVTDYSRFARHGEYVGSPKLGVQGPMNETAMSILPTTAFSNTAYVIPAHSSAYAVNDATFVIWTKLRKRLANAGFFEKTIGAVANKEFLMFQEYAGGNGFITWRVFRSAAPFQAQANVFDQDVGRWIMWTGTYSNAEMRLYKNETLVGTGLSSGSPVDHGLGEFFFGKLGSSIFPGDAELADFKFFPRVLTEDEIRDIHRSSRLYFAEFDVYAYSAVLPGTTIPLVNPLPHSGHLLEPPQISVDLSDEEFGTIDRGDVTIRLAKGRRMRAGEVGDEASRIDTIYSEKNKGGPIELVSHRVTGATSGDEEVVWSGIIDKFSIGDDIEVQGLSLPTGFFEVEIPTTVVDATWPAAFGSGAGTAKDIGVAIPDAYGNVPRVKCVYVNEDLQLNRYDYIVCRGSKAVPFAYRTLVNNNSERGTLVSQINASEYTVSYSLYPGFTCLRFVVQQVTGGSPHEIYADIAVLPADELAEPTKPRNAARIIRTMLQDRDQPIDFPMFNQAEIDCAEQGIYLDFVIQEQTELQDVISNILSIRDMTLTKTSLGWGLRVDVRPSRVAYAINEGDVAIPTGVSIGRLEQLQDMQDLTSEVHVRCLPDLLASGDEDRWLFTAKRPISTNPNAVPLILSFPQIRDMFLGDRVCDYIAKRISSRKDTLAIGAPYAAPIAIRSLVSVTSLDRGLNGAIFIVTGVKSPALNVGEYTLKRWGPNPYVYESGTIPADLTIGTFTDFSRTAPPVITTIEYPSGPTFRGVETVGGETKAFITVRYTTPTSGNFAYAVVRHRPAGSLIWTVGNPIYQSGVVDVRISNLNVQTTYEFSIQSVNAYGIPAGG